jgi:hypothetical protein
MEVIKKGFSIIPDNESSYFSLLEAAISAIDNNGCLHITRNPLSYSFRISPSEAIFIPLIIKELTTLNNLFGIYVDFSKSMKASYNISFSITTF